MDGDPCTYRYLIIGGTTKAATTSVFLYLRDHPEVCAASSKETRFFLDSSYPLPAKYRLEDGLRHYEEYFRHCKGQPVRVEATPDYLYSPGTAAKLLALLPDVRVVFLLRDPVSRLVSWYRYAQQIDQLGKTVSLEDYVKAQLEDRRADRPQHLRALEQGRYGGYLKEYVDVLGRERIHIGFFEHLSADPRSVMSAICDFAGLSGHCFLDYDFVVFNRTRPMRSPTLHRLYLQARFHVGKHTHHHAWIHGLLRRLRLTFEPIYLRANARLEEREGVTLSEALLTVLRKYYEGQAAQVCELAGQIPPWAWLGDSAVGPPGISVTDCVC